MSAIFQRIRDMMTLEVRVELVRASPPNARLCDLPMVTLDPTNLRVYSGITVGQRQPLCEPPPLPGDTLARLRLEKLHLRARMDEVELLIDSIVEERKMRGLPA